MAIKPGWQLNQGTRTPPGGRVRRPGYWVVRDLDFVLFFFEYGNCHMQLEPVAAVAAMDHPSTAKRP
jgi:hypothetical protein